VACLKYWACCASFAGGIMISVRDKVGAYDRLHKNYNSYVDRLVLNELWGRLVRNISLPFGMWTWVEKMRDS